jgi:hypothetical protein
MRSDPVILIMSAWVFGASVVVAFLALVLFAPH